MKFPSGPALSYILSKPRDTTEKDTKMNLVRNLSHVCGDEFEAARVSIHTMVSPCEGASRFLY
jgi:hypothetical protein